MQPAPPPDSTSTRVTQERFISLRTKVGLFLSLIIIATCSGLSWYFLQTYRTALTQRLHDLGTIMVKHVAFNPRVRFAVVTEDRPALEEFLDGIMSVDDVIYGVITRADGTILVQRTKGHRPAQPQRERTSEHPLYPSPELLIRMPLPSDRAPIMSTLIAHPGEPLAVPVDSSSNPFVSPPKRGERLYDFALPILRGGEGDRLPGLSLSDQQAPRSPGSASTHQVLGAIHVGLTQANMNRTLIETIQTTAWLTGAIILAGIAGAVLLTNRMIMRLRSLASVARRVTGGDLNARAEPTAHDEIGQLTWLVNNMTESLKGRDESISRNLATISHQVRQLTTLNQAGTAIASTLNLDLLMSTVLALLTNNLGFARGILVLYYPEDGRARLASGAGFSETLIARLKQMDVPIRPGGGLASEMILSGKPLLVHDIDSIADRIHPPNLAIIKEIGVQSFLIAPLRHHDRTLGYIAGDRGPQRCTQEDLDVLMTVASHVAVAIDNARAYQALGTLTESLEQRVQTRTEELQTANARLKELDQLKSAFVSIVSHELRTPMTSIRGYIDNLLDGLAGPLTDKQRHYLDRVKVNADRLTHMIAELLDLSRIEAGRVELTVTDVDLRLLATDVVEEYQRPATERGIHLTLDAPATLRPITGDRNKLHQILTNLIGNALKFTPADGTIAVTVEAPRPDCQQVIISDSGCGIPPEELPRIFEKFFRGNGIPLETRGAGLGLAIVRTLVELHGGQVSVESRVGAGSRFVVSLPATVHPTDSVSTR